MKCRPERDGREQVGTHSFPLRISLYMLAGQEASRRDKAIFQSVFKKYCRAKL